MRQIFIGFILFAVFMETIGDILFKKWSVNGQTMYLAIGTLIYLVGTAGWAYSLKYNALSKSITVFSVLNLIALVLVGAFMFHEQLTVVNRIGIFLGIVSVILLQI